MFDYEKKMDELYDIKKEVITYDSSYFKLPIEYNDHGDVNEIIKNDIELIPDKNIYKHIKFTLKNTSNNDEYLKLFTSPNLNISDYTIKFRKLYEMNDMIPTPIKLEKSIPFVKIDKIWSLYEKESKLLSTFSISSILFNLKS